jgi:predicted dehydrogenase
MPTSRRGFLTASAAALAAPSIRALGANEKLQIGLIGCGNRGKTLALEAMKLGHTIAAIADVADFRRDALVKAVVDAEQEKPDRYRDYRHVLDRKGIDAVIIATPDHHHRDMLIAAVEAEKDVYIEKPLTKSIEEGKEMIEAVRKGPKRIVQVGNQRHSGPHWRRCKDAIESDDFGQLVSVRVWDSRNWVKRDPYAVPEWFDKESEKQIDWTGFLGKAQKRAFTPLRYWQWRWYWDYAGGLMTDIGAHQLDLVQWLGGVDAPKSVTANGGVYHFKTWETPDVVNATFDYGKFAATFNVEFINGADGVGAAFYGTRQTLIADAEKEVRLYDTADKILPTTEPKERWKVEPETALHVKNWLDCCRSRKEPNSPIELGHRVILSAHLANLSYRTAKKIFWDADRQEIIGG